MSDLISREALLEKLEEHIEYADHDYYHEEPFINLSWEMVEDIVGTVPSVPQWILCNENLPEGCDDAELEVLVYTEEKYIEAEFKEVGFALYYPGEKKFRSVYNHRADITENVVAWMYKPKSYKGE